jgi:hypothetical protein
MYYDIEEELFDRVPRMSPGAEYNYLQKGLKDNAFASKDLRDIAKARLKDEEFVAAAEAQFAQEKREKLARAKVKPTDASHKAAVDAAQREERIKAELGPKQQQPGPAMRPRTTPVPNGPQPAPQAPQPTRAPQPVPSPMPIPQAPTAPAGAVQAPIDIGGGQHVNAPPAAPVRTQQAAAGVDRNVAVVHEVAQRMRARKAMRARGEEPPPMDITPGSLADRFQQALAAQGAGTSGDSRQQLLQRLAELQALPELSLEEAKEYMRIKRALAALR